MGSSTVGGSAQKRQPPDHRHAPAFVRWSTPAESQDGAQDPNRLLRDPARYERIGHGVYRSLELPSIDTDLLEVVARAPRSTLCLASALAWHELTEEIPRAIDLAIPRGSRAPTLRARVDIHRFDQQTYEVGREMHELPEAPGVSIGVYTAERTIADLFRLPNRQVEAIEATRNWLRVRGNHPAELLRVGRQLPRAETRIREALTYLT